MDDSEWPERPGPDADAAEIARWMEEDFGWALAEGAADAVDEDEPDDEHEVVEVEILNHERDEVVGNNRHGRESRNGERGITRGFAGIS